MRRAAAGARRSTVRGRLLQDARIPRRYVRATDFVRVAPAPAAATRLHASHFLTRSPLADCASRGCGRGGVEIWRSAKLRRSVSGVVRTTPLPFSLVLQAQHASRQARLLKPAC